MTTGPSAGREFDEFNAGLLRNHLSQDVMSEKLPGHLAHRKRIVGACLLNSPYIVGPLRAGDNRYIGGIISYYGGGKQRGTVVFTGKDNDTSRGHSGTLQIACFEYVSNYLYLWALHFVDNADCFLIRQRLSVVAQTTADSFKSVVNLGLPISMVRNARQVLERGQHRMGIWSCTEGAFTCTEVGDELQTLISGHLTITRDDGESIECGPGDTIFTRKGERLTWDIKQTVTKVFFTYNSHAKSNGWGDVT